MFRSFQIQRCVVQCEFFIGLKPEIMVENPYLHGFLCGVSFFLGDILLTTAWIVKYIQNGDFTTLFLITAIMGPKSVSDCLWSEIVGENLDLDYLTFHAVSWPGPCDKWIEFHTNSFSKIFIYFDVCAKNFRDSAIVEHSHR